MPTEKTEEFGNVFEDVLRSKLHRSGYFHDIEDSESLFDSEMEEDS